MPRYHTLSKEEERIISKRGTEPPGSGAYNALKEEGIFVCKRCDFPLYLTTDKFASGCGWPSFDEALPGALLRIPDGERIEIRCSRCQAHLGHVFEGEGFTTKNVRYCVNSLSLLFVPARGRALFAGGCFWGMQHCMQSLPGVKSTRVGYMGGDVVHPCYDEVCKGATGHQETLEILFDLEQTSFKSLAKAFFEIHDPTQQGGQGPDVGDQYRSVIFYLSEEQKAVALQLIKELREKGYPVVTEVRPASLFYPAEALHQDYYQRTGKTPYCHTHTPRFL